MNSWKASRHHRRNGHRSHHRWSIVGERWMQQRNLLRRLLGVVYHLLHHLLNVQLLLLHRKLARNRHCSIVSASWVTFHRHLDRLRGADSGRRRLASLLASRHAAQLDVVSPVLDSRILIPSRVVEVYVRGYDSPSSTLVQPHVVHYRLSMTVHLELRVRRLSANRFV